MDKKFKLVSDFKPAGDQPEAVSKMAGAIKNGDKDQVLLGVTGSGKTFVIANLIEKIQKPALILSPNKTLAAQLYAEFKSFFPENAVEYFISYYDYYQPEAYIPQSDTYIEKDASINEHIDRLRLKATSSLMERKDVIVVASVSSIYNIGSPDEYRNLCSFIEKDMKKGLHVFSEELVNIQYERSEYEFSPGKFRVKGGTVEVFPAYSQTALRVEFFSDDIERIRDFDPITGKAIRERNKVIIYPAKHFVTPRLRIEEAVKEIRRELDLTLRVLEKEGKLIEAQRLRQRTKYDIEMMLETNSCHGIENYSRHLSARPKGSRPFCLIDYFNSCGTGKRGDFITVIDESHITIPQVRGMYFGDRSRKETLVKYGFRLPSALDNRPLKFDEFESLIDWKIFVSATPGPYELKKCSNKVAELIIRPTWLVDPEVEVKPIDSQVQDLICEARKCVKKKQRVLVTTLTKKLSEDLTDYLSEEGFRVKYLHSEINALKRIEILRSLRLGEFDVLVGINLLREGLDLPEVALVAVFDADKEGFLRSETTLIQVCGRAARHIDGRVILYADRITGSMKRALDEMTRRRKKQSHYNAINKISPRSIVKAVGKIEEFQHGAKKEALSDYMRESSVDFADKKNIKRILQDMEKQMLQAADELDFELAALIRDKIYELKQMSPYGTKKKKTAK